MKKSLSVILSTAMALSMFSSVAFGKTSADFTDLKDLDAATKAKFDALISAGIFDGVSETTFGLKDEMNRAQFAKVAALITNIEVNKDLKTSSFSDVKVDDAANGYALPFIEALKTAGITDGYAEGQYNPAGKVTKEQLATFLVRVLGKDAEAKAKTGTDTTVSGWAQGYVALALELKLLPAGADGKFGGQGNATRDLLLTGAYEAKQQYVPPVGAKADVVDVKATDASELTLNFNAGLADIKAENFEVKRDGNVVAIKTAVLSENKKSVVITLDSKLIDAKYTVTAKDIANLGTKTSAEVTAVAEKVEKLEFLSASDTIAQASDIVIQFRAVNQYGKTVAGKSASNYEVKISDDEIESTIRNKSGETAFSIDTYVDVDNDKKNDFDIDYNDRFSITIIDEDSRVQVSKILTVGDKAQVSKIEIGDLVDKNGTKIDYIKADLNEKAYLKYTAYDQYGMKVTDPTELNDDVSVSSTDRDLEAGTLVAGVVDDDLPFVSDVDGDEVVDLQLVYVQDEEEKQVDKEVTISVFAGGSVANKVIKIAAVKQPASIEIPAYTGVIADGDYDKYIPIVVKDSNGVALTPREITDNASKFKVYTSGAIEEANDAAGLIENGIVLTGEHVGKLKVAGDGTGASKIELALKEKPEVKGSLNINVVKERKPESIKISSALTDSILVGGYDEFKIKTYDQYGEALEKNYSSDPYLVKVTFEGVGSGSTGATLALPAYADAIAPVVNYPAKTLAITNAVSSDSTTVEFNNNNTKMGYYDATLTLTGTVAGNYKVKAELLDPNNLDASGNPKAVGTALTKTVEVVTGKESGQELTYALALDKGVTDNTIFAATDALADGYSLSRLTGNTIAEIQDKYTDLAKKVKVTAKDSSGSDVGIDGLSVIKSVYSDNTSKVGIVEVGAGASKEFYLVGKDAGTANVTVTYDTQRGLKTSTIAVKTLNDAPVVADIKFGKTSKGIAWASLNGLSAWNGALADQLILHDQFGGEYDVADNTDTLVNEEADFLGLQFAISNVKWSGSTQTGTIDIDNNTGVITTGAQGSISSFTIVVTAPSGKTASIDVIINN